MRPIIPTTRYSDNLSELRGAVITGCWNSGLLSDKIFKIPIVRRQNPWSISSARPRHLATGRISSMIIQIAKCNFFSVKTSFELSLHYYLR